VDTFWSTLGHQLFADATNYPQLNTIKSADDFSQIFLRSNWEDHVILFIDEFDKLYRASDDVKSSCLETLRGIKTKKDNYAIWSVVAIGPFSILYLRSNNLTTSPFNVNNPFKNPNFSLEQVQFLYKQFADENGLTIDQHVIEDIYVQTNGYVTRSFKNLLLRFLLTLFCYFLTAMLVLSAFVGVRSFERYCQG